jgi:hypothetical protein
MSTKMTFRSQRIMVWWAIAFAVIYGLALAFLLHMVPPPNAHQTANQVAHWYEVRRTKIRIGAIIAGYTSAFMLPWGIVCAEQIRREEGRGRIWQWSTLMGGGLMSIFLVLPPLFWGTAAFTVRHNPEITQLMHQLGMLTLTTTDQYYVFMWIAIVIFCFLPKNVTHSPFPRWFGYFTAWTALMFEAGAIAFMAHSGPFAWNGLLVFWSPLTLFAIWLAVMSYLLLTNITKQQAEVELESAVAAN